MKKTLSLLLAVILLIACTTTVYADDFIDLESVPYEEYFFSPWFTSGGLPYVIEPDIAVWLVFRNIFMRYGQIYGVGE